MSIPVLFSVLTGFCTFIFICIFTRISTALDVSKTSSIGDHSHVSIVPYWIPWLGHTLSFARGGQQFLSQCSKTTRAGVFAILLRGKHYTVVTAPSVIRLLQESHSVESSTEVRMCRLRHFFGASGNVARLQHALARQNHDRTLFMGSHGAAKTREYITSLGQAVEKTVYNLISFNESWIDQSSWERSSETIIQVDINSFAKTSFFALIESFVGGLITTTLMGRNFMENNPDITEDFRKWDSKGASFMNQVPTAWSQMSAAAAARSQVLRSLRSFRRAVSAQNAGEDPGSEWADLSDVSPFMMERWNTGKRRSSEVNASISTDAALLWAFNKSTTLTAWLLYRVYSDASLLEKVRREIDHYVRVEQPKSDLPILEPPRVTIDTEGLAKKSVLLRAVMNETLRLHANTITYVAMKEDLVVTESQEDANRFGKATPDSYVLRKDDLICVLYRAQHVDTATGGISFGTFEQDGSTSMTNLKISGVKAVDATSVDVFGFGQLSCPGKGLAEPEMMITCAAILSMWNVDPSRGAWSWPGQKPGLCSMQPVKDVRVSMSRRKTGFGKEDQ